MRLCEFHHYLIYTMFHPLRQPAIACLKAIMLKVSYQPAPVR